MTKKKPKIELARVYDPPTGSGRYRVLIDRLWPRGVKKEDLALDAWPKQLAPSASLRRWFNHDPQLWQEFCERYFQELSEQAADVAELLDAAGDRPILLLYAARDEQHNNAVAFKEHLLRQGSS